jgi:hypothetical protein
MRRAKRRFLNEYQDPPAGIEWAEVVEDALLDGGGVLPGFEVTVAALFEQ